MHWFHCSLILLVLFKIKSILGNHLKIQGIPPNPTFMKKIYFVGCSPTSTTLPATRRSHRYYRSSLLLLYLCTLFAHVAAQDVALNSLPAAKGFSILGAAASDNSGYSVSGLGDVNGDGFGDVIVGAYNADPATGLQAGISYVVYGRDIPGGGTPFSTIQLPTATMAPEIGFRILGATASDISGRSVSGAGDFNKDGIQDIIVGAMNVATMAGIAYVIFGRNIPGGAAAFGDIQLTTGATALVAGVGFRIKGFAGGDRCGSSVSAAGDVNHDGIDDVIIGAYSALNRKGVSYVIYGRNIPVASFTDIQLTNSALSTTVGFRILGALDNDESGTSVSGAGDVNGDGVDDVIVGALGADIGTANSVGITYVIFGWDKPGGAVAFGDVQLTSAATPLSATIGFRLLGAADGDLSGSAVARAGDINKDGIGDILVGAYSADTVSAMQAGITYVIFGRNIPGGATAFGDIQLTTGATTLAAGVGFRIKGAASNDYSGRSLNTAGDVNGDGVDDIIVGVYNADPPSGNDAGIAYVIFGRNIPGGAAAFVDIQLTTGASVLSAAIGFRILGEATNSYCGSAVSSAGDINHDGIADLIIGSYGVSSSAGAAYVIFGLPPSPTSQPSSQPSRQPSRQPSNQPTRQPSRQPSSQPTTQPTWQPTQPSSQPTRQPSRQPSAQPTRQPSCQPSYQPSRQPTARPSARPSSQPSRQPSTRPSMQPSNQPSAQPSSQPSAQPLSRPSSQPSVQPSNQPSRQPTLQPSVQPTRQPSANPSKKPSMQPSPQPSVQPTRQPSGQPSVQPSQQPLSQPTLKPSTQPSSQPTRQPSRQPTARPSAQPSSKPSRQPSNQPSVQPSAQPLSRPSSQPSVQPSYQPSRQPSRQPTGQPTRQPSAQPTATPTGQPSSQPSVQPSTRPSRQPSSQPSAQPTMLPLSMPSVQPSSQPSRQPSNRPSSQSSQEASGQPTTQPMNEPSVQPSQQPTSQPTAQPSCQPTVTPSTQPYALPSGQPSAKPFTQPSCLSTRQPSVQPSVKPLCQPTAALSAQPTNLFSAHPTIPQSIEPSNPPTGQPGQPSTVSSCQPTQQPSMQPSAPPLAPPTDQPAPSAQPNSQPPGVSTLQPIIHHTIIPSTQPSTQPPTSPTMEPSEDYSGQPSLQPSRQSTAQLSIGPTLPNAVSNGEWVAEVANALTLNQVLYSQPILWVCGEHTQPYTETFCAQVEAEAGIELARFSLPWEETSTVLQNNGASSVIIVGRTFSYAAVVSSLAACTTENMQLTCHSKSFPDTSIVAAVHVPFAKHTVYFGKYLDRLLVTIFDETKATFSSYLYTIPNSAMKSVAISHARSRPDYVGAFVVGTCVSIASVNYIVAGVLRTDSGIMTTMCVLPVRGTIMNSAELVNTMALEGVKADSFIAGGLQLSSAVGMHAYLLRVNCFFNSVEYGMRYLVQGMTSHTQRRSLQSETIRESVVRSMVLVNEVLFMIIDVSTVDQGNIRSSVCIAKIAIATGQIIQQVQIESETAGIRCSNVASSETAMVGSEQFLYLTCSAVYNNNTERRLLLSVNRFLSLTALPTGFRRYENDTLLAEKVPFKRVLLPLSVKNAHFESIESTFRVENGNPSLQPSEAPSGLPSTLPSSTPSSQPSSSPTAGPSVSPQPSSQPSSSGPTNTYKPTVKPTQKPSATPSSEPTVKPSVRHTTVPMKRPTLRPSAIPSPRPSRTPTKTPTRAPTIKPTAGPTTLSTHFPTVISTAFPSITNGFSARDPYYAESATSILTYAVGALILLWCLYQLRKWCSYKIHKLKTDKQLMLQMEEQNLPVQSRYPIFSAVVGLFCTIAPSDYHDTIVEPETVEETTTDVTVPKVAKKRKKRAGVLGAESEGAVSTPVFIGAYINRPDFIDLESNADNNDQANADVSSHNNQTSETKVSAVVKAVDTPVAVINTNPDSQPSLREINKARTSVAPTFIANSEVNVMDSDDSSFLSDMVNNMLLEDTESARSSAMNDNDGYSTSTDSSESEETYSNNDYNSADNVV